MIQYLLDTTAIWLLSLLVFDIFLRRETYHGYNRFYLLATFLIGILLPLWPQDIDSSAYREIVKVPVRQISAAREGVTDAVANSAIADWSVWFLAAYLAGAAIALLLLLADVAKLVQYYRSGKRHIEQGLTIVETGKSHSPFSFLHIVFVAHRHHYQAEEWAVICAHEQQHALHRHLMDVILMQTARVVFWFHPLVYLYNNRLLIIHEYQADRIPSGNGANYGRFLIEQAILHAAPTITHSFNRSPIKNRIMMLSRKSTPAAQIKRLVFVPLLLAALVCSTRNVMAQKFSADENGLVKLSSHNFGYSRFQTDTIEMEDPKTGNMVVKVMQKNPVVISIDGKKIEDLKPVFKNNGDATQYLASRMKKELSVLPDGFYDLGIENLIVDENGKTCAFTYKGFSGHKNEKPKNEESINVDKATAQIIFNKLGNELAGLPAWLPAAVRGKKVPSISNPFGDSWQPKIQLKDHKILVKSGGDWIAL
jgi:hypothetical protein